MPTRINIDRFEQLAHGYWDFHLPTLLRYGFPLDFPDEARQFLKSTEENHKSAVEFAKDIENYIKTEKEYSAIFGPFDHPPFGDQTQASPFMSRPKPDSDNRRIIVDLSWPKGASVNHFTKKNIYLGTTYQLKYPTVDCITDHLCTLGKDALIYKIDLARAFRQLPVDPYDYNLLTLKWKKGYFCDVYTPFGHSGGSLTCSRITGLFRYLAYKHGFTTYTYVDDVIGIGLPVVAKEGFSYMTNLLEELNFPISTSKLVSPSEEATCLGIIINARKQTLSIPQGKLQEIITKCTDIMDKKSVTRRQFQSVLGSLMFIHKCVKSARIFTNRLLDSLRKSSSSFIHITEDIRKDLRWFLYFTSLMAPLPLIIPHLP